MDQTRVCEILDSCLLTDLEFVQGPDFWKDFEDTLPALELDHFDEEANA